MTAGHPSRVLHVHSDLLWGGVEQWLLHVVRAIDRSRYGIDLFSASVSPVWERAIRDGKANLVRSPRPRAMWRYLRELRAALRSGRYGAVHCHFIDHGGMVLREAALAGVKLRIAHSHLDVEPLLATLPVWSRAYLRAQNRLVKRYATRGLAASREAAASMFGRKWQADPRWSVLQCGIDLQPFAAQVDRDAVRQELGLEPHDFVLGHVGRFTDQKNHAFLIDVAAALAAVVPRMRLVCVGEGPLEPEIQARAATAGLEKRIRFAGIRADAPRVLRAMDGFIFPSKYEGLGLALVEAQAAGLRCFASDVVPAEATVVPQLVTRLPLNAGASWWAAVIAKCAGAAPPVGQARALAGVRQSVFNIDHSVRRLEALYDERA